MLNVASFVKIFFNWKFVWKVPLLLKDKISLIIHRDHEFEPWPGHSFFPTTETCSCDKLHSSSFNRLDPFPHTTTILQQTTFKTYWQDLNKWEFNYKSELKTWCQKEKLLVLSNFLFCHKVFKIRLLKRHQKASMRERVKVPL